MPLKSKTVAAKEHHGTTPHKHRITLIEHDHLRRCAEDLSRLAPETVFIIDEVHKAMNNSQRTDCALLLSHICRQFVAFTGTPIVDTKVLTDR